MSKFHYSRLPEPQLDYTKTPLSKRKFDTEVVIERRVVRCLRKMRRDYIFEDLHTLQVPESEVCPDSSDRLISEVKVMSPLAYHDIKCRYGCKSSSFCSTVLVISHLSLAPFKSLAILLSLGLLGSLC